MMPALATSTSTGPCAASISVNAASTEAGSVTSHVTAEEALGRLAAAVGDGDLVAVRRERLGDGPADATVAAGDEDRARSRGARLFAHPRDASGYCRVRQRSVVLEAEAELEPTWKCSTVAVLDLAADLGDLEPVEVAQGREARSTPLRIAWSMPSGEVPTISVTR